MAPTEIVLSAPWSETGGVGVPIMVWWLFLLLANDKRGAIMSDLRGTFPPETRGRASVEPVKFGDFVIMASSYLLTSMKIKTKILRYDTHAQSTDTTLRLGTFLKKKLHWGLR